MTLIKEAEIEPSEMDIRSYLQVPGQGVHDLFRPNIVIDKDVLAMSDGIQGLL